MDLLIPEAGIIIWMLIGFSIAFYILAKFAWKPIVNALKERDNSIASALKAAEEAKKEVSQLHSESEMILAEARAKGDDIIQEARQLKDSIINEATGQAKKESLKMIEEARKVILNEKASAVQETP